VAWILVCQSRGSSGICSFVNKLKRHYHEIFSYYNLGGAYLKFNWTQLQRNLTFVLLKVVLKVILREKRDYSDFFSLSVLDVIIVLKSNGYEHFKCTLELMSG
jgi:hypothetical protein